MRKLFLLFAVCFLYLMTAASLKVIAQPSTDIDTYVLFAYNELSFKGGSAALGWGTIYGNIGVNYAGMSSTGYSLAYGTSGYAFMADGYEAAADNVRADAAGSFYTLYANALNPAFSAIIRDPLEPPVFPCPIPIIPTASLPVFPFTPNRALTNGASNLTVATGATYTFIPSPFAYKDVRINDHATVTFGPGIFDMRNLSLGKFVTIIVDPNTILQIDRMFDPNDFMLFGGIGTESAKIYVGSYNINGRVTNFSHNSEIHAWYFSPTGWLDIGGHNELFGNFIAARISGDANNNVYIPHRPCPPPCTFNPCQAPFSNVVITDINQYVLFAYDQLEWKGGNLAAGWGYIYGNIGVMNPSSWNSNNFSLIFGSSKGAYMADGYQAVADFVRADDGSSFYQLFANTLNNNFGADIRLAPNLPVPTTFPMAVVPPPLGFTPGRALTDGAADIHILDFGTWNPAPGPFRDVRIEDHGVVTFGPGTYDLRNLDVGKNVTINVDDATILQIDRTFMNNTDFKFGIGTHAGAKIYVGSFGIANNQKTSFFSKRAEIHASYFAPNGILDLGDNSLLYGHFWARRITGDPNNVVFCDVFPGSSAPISSVNAGTGEGVQISIFPNPAQESFTLRLNNSVNQGSVLTLNDLTGKEIFRTSLQLQAGVTNYPVSIAGISQGVYIVKLQTGTGVGQTKLIINH